MACKLYPTLDSHMEAICINNAYHHLYDHDHLSMSAQVTLISLQLAPFPMLAITKSTNTAVVLHCITVFHPALGSANWQHPAAGLIIAFMGDMMQYGHPPLVVTIPTNAFDHAKPWKIPEDKTFLEAPPETFDLVPVDSECTVNIAKMIPIPPT